jgi:hypothetical protein
MPRELSHRGHVLGELPNKAILLRLLVSSRVVEQFHLEIQTALCAADQLNIKPKGRDMEKLAPTGGSRQKKLESF